MRLSKKYINSIKINITNIFGRDTKEFLSKVQLELGEQKIDIVIAKDKNRNIEKEALKTGIEL